MHKIAIIQFSPEVSEPEHPPREDESNTKQLNKPDHNHARAIKFIRDAAASGAQLAVLPEFHLADFFPSHDPAIRQQCANWKKYLNSYCALAKELSICIVPGTIGELHVDGNSKTERLVNVAYFIDHTGTICGRYEKQNLWIPEREFVDKGQGGHVAFDTPLGRVGLLVCWDLAFPEAFRNLIRQGAKLIIMPAFWKLSDASEAGLMRNPRSEAVFVDAAVPSRAFENTATVVFCNVAGPAEDGYAGHSQVALPFLGCVGKIDGCQEEMKIVEVDMTVLDEAEEVYQIRKDIRKKDWHYGYRL